jgi:hypothetical protein
MDRVVRWERIGAATGFAFVAVLIASFVVIPSSPPALDDPVGDIKTFYVDNASRFQASFYLTGIAAFFLLWFLGSLRAALARAEVRSEAGAARVSSIVMPAGAVTLALVLANGAVADVLATRAAAEADQAVIRALYDLQAFTITFVCFPLAALVAATSVVSQRTRLLPPLVTWLGFLLVPGWLVAGFGVFEESGAFSPTGAVGLIVLLAWLAWVLAVSAALLWRAGAVADPR